MNILVTIDANYLKPLQVMLHSLFFNNPDERFSVYLLHSGLEKPVLDTLESGITARGSRFFPLRVEDDCFGTAPLLFYYPKEMYFRLLACRLLPDSLDRVLYLDPDLLILNPVRALYETDMENALYGAAYHNKLSIRSINKLRLYPYEIEAYYNSGVLLMNLERQRREVNEAEIFRFIEENRAKLVMPDQDILNSLYAKRICTLDEHIANYDARYYAYYKLTSSGHFDMDQVMRRTVALHFCGKRKPWHKRYAGVFLSLYKHYEKQAEDEWRRLCGSTLCPPPAAVAE